MGDWLRRISNIPRRRGANNGSEQPTAEERHVTKRSKAQKPGASTGNWPDKESCGVNNFRFLRVDKPVAGADEAEVEEKSSAARNNDISERAQEKTISSRYFDYCEYSQIRYKEILPITRNNIDVWYDDFSIKENFYSLSRINRHVNSIRPDDFNLNRIDKSVSYLKRAETNAKRIGAEDTAKFLSNAIHEAGKLKEVVAARLKEEAEAESRRNKAMLNLEPSEACSNLLRSLKQEAASRPDLQTGHHGSVDASELLHSLDERAEELKKMFKMAPGPSDALNRLLDAIDDEARENHLSADRPG